MKKKWFYLSLICLIIIIIILYYVLAPGIPVKTAKVKRGDITEYIDQRAETSLPRVYKITMPYDGRIYPPKFSEGNAVKKGDIVAQIVPDVLNTQLQIALAKRDELKGQIEINQYNTIWDTANKEAADWITAMKQIVGIAQKKLDITKNIGLYAIKFRDSQILSGLAVSEIKKAEAEMEAEVKLLDVESAMLMLQTMVIIQKIFEIAPVYISEFMSIKKLEKNVLECELKQAEEDLKRIQNDIALSTMPSPIDGVVLRKYVENERFLPAGSELLDIGYLNDLQIEADVLSTDAPEIKVDDPVKISLSYDGSNPFDGKVIKVDPQAFTKISSLGVEEQRVKVTISIDNKTRQDSVSINSRIGYKYRVFARIFTANKGATLIIPRSSLTKNNNGQWIVYKNNGNRAELQIVTIGLINEDSAEVLQGLKENDEVIQTPPSEIVNGSKIAPILK
ncbi:MAG TPA: hypothetical protein DD381_11180 [Lentisphaeria bacterium]|nr:MAG: hypothetical protein A2X47_00420 [Lentisphaerae bacterium GWF2_38_69]HBM16891.1 hypothetical protein [Lentisphaeria bacterium]